MSSMRSSRQSDVRSAGPTGRSYQTAMCTAFALAIGLGIGWIDLQVTEVAVTVLALVLGGALLGLLQPRAAWRWAVLLALGIPAMELIGKLLSVPTAEPVRLDPRIAVVALAFALVGCYSGAAVRRMFDHQPVSG